MAIIPAFTDLTRPYWENAREGRLVTQRCRACASIWHPPLPACPHCQSTDIGWDEVSGTGTVYTYTVVRHATHAALAGHIPYVIAIVELTALIGYYTMVAMTLNAHEIPLPEGATPAFSQGESDAPRS